MTFNNYEKNIREEYYFVPEDIYHQKRNEIIKSLKTPYRTPVGEKLWGENRTKNLAEY